MKKKITASKAKRIPPGMKRYPKVGIKTAKAQAQKQPRRKFITYGTW
ncbi:MAG: hypothetical protein ABH871_05180 [Pseudomonadota bacterium]